MQNRPEVERFCQELRQRLELLDIEIRNCPAPADGPGDPGFFKRHHRGQ